MTRRLGGPFPALGTCGIFDRKSIEFASACAIKKICEERSNTVYSTGPLLLHPPRLDITYPLTSPPSLHRRKHSSPLASIAPAILPPRPPPLLPQLAVELGLPQLPVHVVVRVAEPRAELPPAPHHGPPPRDVVLEVLGAGPARVQPGEEAHEAQEVGLLLARGRLRVLRRYGVQERPGAAAEGLDVGRAVGGRLVLERGLGGRGPGGEGRAVAAAVEGGVMLVSRVVEPGQCRLGGYTGMG